jgi:hypothetical protein
MAGAKLKAASGYWKHEDRNSEVYNKAWPEFSAQEDCIKEASCVKSPRKFSIDKRGALTADEISVNRDSGTYKWNYSVLKIGQSGDKV